MKKKIRLFKIIGLSLLVLSCNRFEMESPADEARNPSLMRFAASYPLAHTRADEAGFADGDKMGVFVTDYENGSPGVLKADGNRADNVRFTFDESSMSWTGATDIYWKDDKTPVDIYGYYPFDADILDVEDYRFSVSVRQDAAPTGIEPGGYEASDLLWAKSENVHPTSEIVTLTYGHMMAGVKVILQMGEGFEEAEWASLSKTVLIRNVVADASVNLASGEIVPVEGVEVAQIVPCSYMDEFRAVVVPQRVSGDLELLSITVDGMSYSYSRPDGMTYASGMMHRFTIKVDKRGTYGDYYFSIQEDSVSVWKDDPEFYDYVLRDYISVCVDSPGNLEKIISQEYHGTKITSLKLSGQINRSDLDYLADYHAASLINLNMYDVRIVGDDEEKDVLSFKLKQYEISNFRMLSNLVLPKTLRKIDDYAFCGAQLTGSIRLPEGLEEIGIEAFAHCSLYGELELPKSLRILRAGAFYGNRFTGELVLPDGLEMIGPREGSSQFRTVFEGSRFSGSYNLPSNLKYYYGLPLPGMIGDIVIPQGVKEVVAQSHMGSTCTSLIMPEGVIMIGYRAFMESLLQGELRFPNSCRLIGSEAFAGTKITGVIFHDDISFIGDGAFSDTRISGRVVLPQSLNSVSDRLFEGCSMIESIVIPDKVVSIDENAFAYCHNLKSVVCMAEEPPVLAENAFEGVPRDNFTIEVPAGSVDKYKRAEGWREFKRIAEYSDFVCRPATSCALNSSRRQTLVLNADGPWTVSHLPEWCLVSPQSGDGKTEVTLTVNELAHGAGHRADSVVFTLADGGHKTWCQVSQYDYEYDEDEVIALQKATKGNGIDVMFIGDGWDGEAIANGGYLALVREQMEHFFGVEPYATYRDYFNVYAGIALSQETGVNTLNTYRDTRFGTIYGGGGCNGVEPHMSVEKDLIFEYVTQHSPIQESNLWKSLVVLVPNSTDYGGCTQLYEDGSAISICCPSEQAYPNDTRGIVQHEAGGHGFGKLADEKIMKNMFADKVTKNQIEHFHRLGWYQNVAISGKMSDVPWSHFIFDPEYSDYVDIFEGAMGFTRGVWRSEQNSCMNYGIPYYNAISRQEIMRRILDYSGEGFTMEKFYATDSKEWGSSSAQTKAVPVQAYVENVWYTAPYVE